MKLTRFAMALALTDSPVTAQGPPVPSTDITAEDMAALDRAVVLGRRIYDYDRAAWVSTDAMVAQLPRDAVARVQGWVTLPAGDTLETTYFTGVDGNLPDALFVARTRQGKLVAARSLITAPVALTAEQARIAAATATARRITHTPCAAKPFNTVALPPARPEDPVAVYLLTPQVTNDVLPMGGHYRVDVAADGTIAADRAFTKACLAMQPPAAAKGRPSVLVVSQLLGSLPTEMHVFQSLSFKLPIAVITTDKRLWMVTGGPIRLIDTSKAGAARRR